MSKFLYKVYIGRSTDEIQEYLDDGWMVSHVSGAGVSAGLEHEWGDYLVIFTKMAEANETAPIAEDLS